MDIFCLIDLEEMLRLQAGNISVLISREKLRSSILSSSDGWLAKVELFNRICCSERNYPWTDLNDEKHLVLCDQFIEDAWAVNKLYSDTLGRQRKSTVLYFDAIGEKHRLEFFSTSVANWPWLLIFIGEVSRCQCASHNPLWIYCAVSLSLIKLSSPKCSHDTFVFLTFFKREEKGKLKRERSLDDSENASVLSWLAAWHRRSVGDSDSWAKTREREKRGSSLFMLRWNPKEKQKRKTRYVKLLSLFSSFSHLHATMSPNALFSEQSHWVLSWSSGSQVTSWDNVIVCPTNMTRREDSTRKSIRLVTVNLEIETIISTSKVWKSPTFSRLFFRFRYQKNNPTTKEKGIGLFVSSYNLSSCFTTDYPLSLLSRTSPTSFFLSFFSHLLRSDDFQWKSFLRSLDDPRD